jgi:pimeloyl-ACP methyl ester carboxylesterase
MSGPNVTNNDAYSTRMAMRQRVLEGLPVVEQRIRVAGVSTALIRGGTGSPLVLLHGQGGSGIAWAPVLPRLLESHHVIAPDLPGLGESVVESGEIDPELAVAWLKALLQETCTEPPVVVGFSLGGSFAARLGVLNEVSCRLFVLADSGSLAPFRPDPGILPALIRLNIRPNGRNLKRFFSMTMVDFERFHSSLGDRWPAFEAYGLDRNSDPSVKTANRQLLRRIGTKQIPASDLAGIKAPVALIWGDQDRVMRVGIARAAHEKFGWPLHLIENSGHTTKWDQPDAFIDALESAIKETD